MCPFETIVARSFAEIQLVLSVLWPSEFQKEHETKEERKQDKFWKGRASVEEPRVTEEPLLGYGLTISS